jgi:thiol-disulfide isomerase/thioredoxin
MTIHAFLKCLLPGLLVLGLATRGAAQAPRTITLIKEGSPEDFFLAYYQNEFQDQVTLAWPATTEAGHQPTLRLAVGHPLWLQLATSAEQYVLYAQPGDTLYVQTHPGQTPYYTFRAPRPHPARQAELNFFTTLQRRNLDVGTPDYAGLFVNARYPQQVERLCTKFDQRLALLHRQRDSLALSPAFVQFVGRQVRAQYLSTLFYPYWDKDQAFRQFPASYDQLLATSGAAQFLTTDTLVITSAAYRSAAVSYVRYLSRDSVGTPTELATEYHHARAALQGKTRDYALFFLLKQNLGKQLATYPTYFDQFRRDCTTPAYVHYLDSVAARPAMLQQRPELAATPLRSSSGESLTWAQLLSRNRGKVLYLDLWASWCGPCLAEMPASATLQKALAGQAVEFVYFSIDQDPAKWHQALATHQLARPGTQHYLLDPTSALAKFLNAPPIPRYVLLDQQGQVVSLDAAKPSNPLLNADLAKLLR